jgi:hypothetical protein
MGIDSPRTTIKKVAGINVIGGIVIVHWALSLDIVVR